MAESTPVSVSEIPGERAPVSAEPRRLFLTDLHLDGGDSPRAATFRAVLERLAADAHETPTHVYILGDLFDFWEEHHRQIPELYERDLRALEEAHKAGVQFWLLSGNRDFSYGRYVQDRFGAHLLGDGGKVTLSDQRKVWVEHGDLLCVDDLRYLKYRKWVRSPMVRFIYRMLPWSLARKAVERVKATSDADRKKKDTKVFEPNPDVARSRLETQGCCILLCGHTHRPQASDLGAGLRLIVVPAWCEVCSGYRELRGSFRAVHFYPDGSPAPADVEGRPEV